MSECKKKTSIFIPHIGWLDYFVKDDVVTFLREGWFEYKEMAFLWLYVRENDIVIDGGAHVGLYSLLSAALLRGTGTIFSIEAAPETAKLLKKNLEKNNVKNYKIIQSAISSKNGRLPLYLNNGNKSAYDSVYVNQFSKDSIEVNSESLDKILIKHKIDIVNYLKLDIEGSEYDALIGAQESIKKNKIPLMMVEFTEANLKASGHSTKGLYLLLKSLGYGLFRFNENTFQLEDYDYEGPVWYENLFACYDLDCVNNRLKTASPQNIKIAKELVLRGKESHSQKDKIEKLEFRESIDKKTIKNFKNLANERLILLRHCNIQRRLAEKRIDNELICRWPLRLAYKYRIIRRPIWLAGRYSYEKKYDKVDDYIQTHPIEIEKDNKHINENVKVTIILCTYNPNIELLNWALESIANQDIDPRQYELIIVDNNSDLPVDLSQHSIMQMLSVKIVREKKQGLIFARLAGIHASVGNIIIFVDDDNYIAPDYVKQALLISENSPEIGLFGGMSHGQIEGNISGWKKKLLPYLGIKNEGNESITSFESYWGPWEPIGAGMVSRRDVAIAYAEFVENNPASAGLGRQGSNLLSCEDSLFARIANISGYACSYQPSLQLHHHIGKERLSASYLFRLMKGMGISYVRLERVLGRETNMKHGSTGEIFARLIYKIGSKGIAGIFQWAWDLGYFEELARKDDI